MFWQKKVPTFLSTKEIETVLNAIRENEANTSGEIRICIESKCAYVNPLTRAHEIFHELKMYKTKNRNAVLIYIAYEDRDFALYADGAIFNKLDLGFWKKESSILAKAFFNKNYVEGIVNCVSTIGNELTKHFPLHGEQKNELPDDIIFGK